MSSCEKDKFDIAHTIKGAVRKSEFCKVIVTLQINDKFFIEEEQYYVYDFNSFFADVGGYMGLLLGSSLLSIYDEIGQWLNWKKVTSFFGIK